MTYDPYGDGCDNCGGEDHTCDTCPEFASKAEFDAHEAEHAPVVRQINIADDVLAERLFVAFKSDPFTKPLIASLIMGHREGDVDCTERIRRALGWDS